MPSGRCRHSNAVSSSNAGVATICVAAVCVAAVCVAAVCVAAVCVAAVGSDAGCWSTGKDDGGIAGPRVAGSPGTSPVLANNLGVISIATCRAVTFRLFASGVGWSAIVDPGLPVRRWAAVGRRSSDPGGWVSFLSVFSVPVGASPGRRLQSTIVSHPGLPGDRPLSRSEGAGFWREQAPASGPETGSWLEEGRLASQNPASRPSSAAFRPRTLPGA
jgi:hypothetical protein